MGERIDDPAVLLDFPVDVRAGRRTGHADERDGLPARDAVPDGDERRGRVVVAALEPFGVLHADPASADLDPAGRIDDAVVGRDDDRAIWRGDVNAGVVSLEELADRAGDRPDEAARGVCDASHPRARGRVGAQVDALPARDAAPIELELRLVQARPADAREPAAVRAERAGAEEIGGRSDPLISLVSRVPHRYAIEHVPAGHSR